VIRLMIAAGGTGGHLFPALAVAQQLREIAPEAAIAFVGGDKGLESRVVPAHGFELHTLQAGRLKGATLLGRARTLVGLAPVLRRAMRLLRMFRPSIVLGAGGYASAPVVMAAAMRRVPVVLLEQNAIAGLTNRLLARVARRVITAFPQTEGLPARRVLQLGNPIRPQLAAELEACASKRRFDNPRRVLVLGGSQGAHRVNELLSAAVPQIARELGELEVVHQTGAADRDAVSAAYRASAVESRVDAFIEQMGNAYCRADLMIGRSGATTLAELAVAGLPALFVPYPFAADGHQAANARALVEAGAALEFDQTTLTPETLVREVTELLRAPERLRAMSDAMRDWGKPRAAAAVVDLLLELGS
jgi:UDP-N-acetylglucosamine--N-acetylmuramyl-(pentapeptide) pyrophosphoryl-undecaprenol N-acetylglucosamine transferase